MYDLDTVLLLMAGDERCKYTECKPVPSPN